MIGSVVVIHLRSTGDAPVLKQAKFKVTLPDNFCRFGLPMLNNNMTMRLALHFHKNAPEITSILRTNLEQKHLPKLSTFFTASFTGTLCAFSPTPDEQVIHLYDVQGERGKWMEKSDTRSVKVENDIGEIGRLLGLMGNLFSTMLARWHGDNRQTQALDCSLSVL
ncbi:hypothetical protein RJ641_005819 [Dillenia turbinata]|uniref:Uncharacterized protein n=1 Tax=Dillenia turbinata TaxID=194707 RepID=A0AAN8ZB79_9MAGN